MFYTSLRQTSGPNVILALTTLIADGDGTTRALQAKLKPATTEDKIAPHAIPNADRIRDHRAIEILERIGTPAARAVLEALAKGHPGADATIDAKQSLARLTGR